MGMYARQAEAKLYCTTETGVFLFGDCEKHASFYETANYAFRYH